jgi:penicillin-binding protein 1C
MRKRSIARTAFALCGLLVLVGAALVLDRLLPPDLTKLRTLSPTLTDRHGGLLRVKLSDDGMIRLATRADDVNPLYLGMLIAYEDKRFASHPGVDPRAMARAIWQAVSNWRVISGGSTLTMQVARLLEPRSRTLWAKLVECARALQLERRYTKAEILDMYLTLAPFGGPLEGARAASLAYFDKEPRHLTPAQAALLVALPQAPSRLRPERYPERARLARNKILARTLARWNPEEAATARLTPPPRRRHDFPLTAPHLADRFFARSGGHEVKTTLDRDLQVALNNLTRRHENAGGETSAAAILVIDNASGEVRAYVGSGDYLSVRRRGGVDMVRAWRSPGSTLKPFIYGLAMDAKLIHPATLISDRPRSFSGYAPRNFGGRGLGDVAVADALRLSLNVPAVAVLSALGPVTLLSRLEHAGVAFQLPNASAPPGLAIALGGLAGQLEGITALYSALANGGEFRAPRLRAAETVGRSPTAVLDASKHVISANAARLITDILRTGSLPPGHANRLLGPTPYAIAFKTGTSYGFRDAWAFGYTPSHTVGVWTGHVDGTPRPGASGRGAALPLLFDAFATVAGWAGADWRIWDKTPLVPAVAPVNLARLALPGDGSSAREGAPALDLHFPTDGMVLELTRRHDGLPPVPLRAMGGRGALTWLVNGEPLRHRPRRVGGRRAEQTVNWRPRQAGGAKITVMDRAGRARSAHIWINAPSGSD